MKRIIIAFSLLLTCGMAAADLETPKQVRVSVQYIAMPHTIMTELLAGEEADGAKLHESAVALTKEGKAKLLETSMVVCRSGQKATVESIREEIYPTEYDPDSFSPNPVRFHFGFRPFDGAFVSGFETRNAGVSMEVQASVDTRRETIKLSLVPEVVSRLGLVTWVDYTDHWGDASVRLPIYETWRANTSVTVRSGKFALVSAITPKRKEAAPFVDSRILLFVRADILEVQ